MEIIGYLSAVLIGITLGLTGGGGSILTVPILVYFFKIDVVAATAYSLFIVGISSTIGSYSYFRNNLVNIKTALLFGIPSIVAVYLTRSLIITSLPSQIFSLGSFKLSKGVFLLILFALLMIIASYRMIKEDTFSIRLNSNRNYNYILILVEGFIVGILTGLVGAGGGFLIIPALVILNNIPIKEAVGTSLVIIAAKSLIGFLGEGSETIIDWNVLIKVLLFAVLGIFIGIHLSKKIDGAKLKPVFGWFILLVGIFIILKETIFTYLFSN